MKIAFVTPWPDDRSGIADYAFDLISELDKLGENITVFTLAQSPEPCGNVSIENLPVEQWDLKEFDVIVYQLGNSRDFHGHMWELIQRFPGIVHLHDLVLHHLIATQAAKQDNWLSYFEGLEHLYGAAVRAEGERAVQMQKPLWEADDVLNLPMSEIVLQHSYGAVVHSKFVRDRIVQRLPLLPTLVVPQTYPNESSSLLPRAADDFCIGIFGHVHHNREVHVVLKALCDPRLAQCDISVRVVGPCPDEKYTQHLMSLAALLKPNIKFEILGYSSYEDFLNELTACDVCISLRNPSQGETSAIVTRALQCAKPIVVTRTAWYAELPDCVLKIGSGIGSELDLAEILLRLIHDPLYRKDISLATSQYAKAVYDHPLVVYKYRELLYNLNMFHNDPKLSDTSGQYLVAPIADALQDLELDSQVDEADLRSMIYQKLAFCFE